METSSLVPTLEPSNGEVCRVVIVPTPLVLDSLDRDFGIWSALPKVAPGLLLLWIVGTRRLSLAWTGLLAGP